jgi:hypothetical protein
MSKTFPEKIENFDVSFSSIFLFYRVFRCFSAMGVQKHHKNLLQNNRVKKFYKKIDKNPKPIFFSIFSSRFWANIGEKNAQPWDLLGLRGTNQPRRGPSFFGGPLGNGEIRSLS